MSLVEYAKKELELAGYSLDGDDINTLMAKNVIELIDTFAKQGHSGMSAPYCIQLFDRLASYKPILPLTGEPKEWHEINDDLWQNNRCSTIFKDKNHAWNIEGIVFKDKDGRYYTNKDSRVDVVFPYEPSDPVIQEFKDHD
jgi:hypothetical protein